MKKSLNIGTVGCGRIAGKHLAALTSDHVKANLVAVCDLIEEKAKEKGEQYNVPYYLSAHDMIKAHPEIDVIDVLTPTGYHAENVVEFAQFGRHIICEKPMALRVEDCDRMIEACQHNNCRLFIVKQNRFNRAILAARRALEQGRFGKLVLGTVRVRWRRDQGYYDQANWRGTWKLDGGVVAQQATHHLDLLQWFMGPIDFIQSQIATRLMDIEVEDTAAAIMRFKNGALGVFEATTATRPNDLEGSLSILGEKGSVIIGGPAVNMIEHWKFEVEEPEDAAMGELHSHEVENVYGHGHMPYLASVIDAILEDKPAAVGGDEGRKNVEILTALYESAASGKPVHPGAPVVHARIGERE
ncbi:MAG: Gfo/Idh/MocA family oxidoreductase [Spartobacteria bacterium]|nr:Gfo/Idh/MocA family oxidoreductase [Spartobacteria bacterium]